MATKSLWERERWFLLSSLLWRLFLIRWLFLVAGIERELYSCDSSAEEFDLLLLSPPEGSAVHSHPWLLPVWGTCFMFHWADRRQNHFPCAERKPWWLGSWEWKLPSHLSACNMSCQNRCWRTRWQSPVACFLWSSVVCELVSFPGWSVCCSETRLQGYGLRQECVPSLGWDCRNPSPSK